MNKRAIIALGAIIFLGLGIIYVYFGGLNSVEVAVENVTDYNLVGKRFKGMNDSDTLRDAFFEARELAQSGEMDGVLTLVHYKDTTLTEEQVNVFVGIKLNAGTSDLPSGYSRMTIPARRTVRARVEAHNSVMPSSETVENRLLKQAEDLGLELQDFTIEQYLNEREIWIDMPVKQ